MSITVSDSEILMNSYVSGSNFENEFLECVKTQRNAACLGGADEIKQVQQKMELLDLTGIILLSVSRFDSQKE